MSPSLDVRENRELASEIKFHIPSLSADPIRDWARARLSPDPNAVSALVDAYHITSIYFDTENFDVFHRNGSFGRCKYRIRRYGTSEVAFLERKLKTRGLVTKRRSAVELPEFARLAEPEPDPGWAGFWFHQRLLARRLKPICQISYWRAARVLMTPYGTVRLTVDRDIRTLPAKAVAFADSDAGTPLSTEHVIIELKYRVEMPVLFKQLVEEFALTPKRVSKYRLAVVALGLASEPAPAVPPNGAPAVQICLTS